MRYLEEPRKVKRIKSIGRYYRVPEPLLIRLKDLVFNLKQQDYQWTETRIVCEAIEYYLDTIRKKQKEQKGRKK